MVNIFKTLYASESDYAFFPGKVSEFVYLSAVSY